MNFLKKNWIKIIGLFILLLLLFWLFFIKFNQKATAPNNENLNINTNENLLSTTTTVDASLPQNTMPIVKIQTTKGDITIELFNNDAPKTVANFLTLVNKGFYDNVIFHRVISGFMIQGGDPTGTGRGGPGYQFADELDPKNSSYQAGYVRGTVAMANSGPNTNGSQFFIMHQNYPLPNNYTIFGRVIAGLETVDAIATSKTDAADRPLEEIKIKKAEVVE